MAFNREAVELSITEAPLRVIGWRNFWFSLKDHTTVPSKTFHPQASIFPGTTLHPTKEAAEVWAQKWLRRNGREWSEYLGAFEVTV